MVADILRGLPDRFRPIEEIGRGAYKVVWRARDELLRRDIAMALFRSGVAVRGEALLEAQRMARISDHPRIATIHDILVCEEQLLLIMQLIRGGLLNQAPAGSDARRNIALQVCEGLRHIHRSGYAHGDMKPENVLLDSVGNAFLTDFGLAQMLGTRGQGPVGTPGYMAPEVVRGGPPTQLSDMYSLGCVLYELFTGKPVFDDVEGGQLLQAHLTRAPVPPRVQSSDVPLPLSETIMSLLVKAPERRCDDIGTVAGAIAESSFRRRPSKRSVQPRIVGRTPQLRQLERAFTKAGSGEARCLVVAGEAGIGKTAFAEEATRLLDERDFLVFTARGYEADTLGYSAILTALLPHAEMLDVFSEVGEKSGLSFDAGTAGMADRALFALRALERLARSEPIAFIVDDAQWLDEQSQWFVSELINTCSNSLTSHKLVTILTVRRTPGAAEPSWIGRLRRDHSVTGIDLEGLSDGEIAELIETRAHRKLSAVDLTGLAAASGGNPLYLLSRLSDQGSGDAGALQTLLEKRIEKLSPDSLDVLRIASLQPREPDADMLTGVMNRSSESIWDSLAEAEQAGILTVADEGIRFSHPLFRTLLSEQWGTLNRQRAELRIALAMRNTIEDDQAALQDYVDHLLKAGRFGEELEDGAIIARAARAAFASGNLSRVHRFCTGALRRSQGLDDRDRGRLHYMAAMSLRSQNDLDDAVDEFDQAIAALQEAPGPDLVLAWKYKLLSLSHQTSGDVDTSPLETLASQLEGNDQQSWVLAMLTIADLRLDQLQSEMSLETVERILSSGIAIEHAESSTLYNIKAGASEQLMRFEEASKAFGQALEHAQAAGVAAKLNETVCQMPRPALFQGRFEEALALSKHARELHGRTRNHRQLIRSTASEACALVAVGRLAEAEDRLDELYTLLHRTGFDQLSGDVVFVRAQLDVLMGRFDHALAAVDDLINGKLVRNYGPFQSVGALYKALILREAGMETNVPALRHPRTVIEGRMDPFRMNRVCLNILLAAEDDADLVRESLSWLERGVACGQLFTSMWIFFIPSVIACGRSKLGQIEAAMGGLENAGKLAEYSGSVLARYQISSVYVTLLRQAGLERESRVRAREARQLLKVLQDASTPP